MATAIRRDAAREASEVMRARRRAAFIARIRSASGADVTATRAASATHRPEPQASRRPAAQATTRTQGLDSVREREGTPVDERPRRPTVSPQVVVEAPRLPDRGIFREEAIRHLLSAEEGRGLVRVSPPWTWALLWVVVAGVGAALAASFLFDVEVTGRGRGILQPTTGVRALTSQMTGTVARVEARSGDRVKAGAPLLRLESATAQAQLLEADRELEALRTRFAEAASQQDRHYAEQVQSLNARARRLAEQIASLRGSLSHQEQRLEADRQLLRKGLVAALTVAETQDALAQAQRQLIGAESTLDQTRQELASLEGRRQDDLWQRQQHLDAARNKRDSVAVMMQQAVILAPEDGTVEALLPKVGDVVQAGQVVGRIVPVDSPLQAVSFLPEKDRAFAKPGDEVHLELDQLPHAEYGTLRARIVRIGDDLASPSEIRDALGDGQRLDAPSYRVELQITDAHAADAAGVKLRTGTLLDARFTLRRQRLVTLVLSPLRAWFR